MILLWLIILIIFLVKSYSDKDIFLIEVENYVDMHNSIKKIELDLNESYNQKLNDMNKDIDEQNPEIERYITIELDSIIKRRLDEISLQIDNNIFGKKTKQYLQECVKFQIDQNEILNFRINKIALEELKKNAEINGINNRLTFEEKTKLYQEIDQYIKDLSNKEIIVNKKKLKLDKTFKVNKYKYTLRGIAHFSLKKTIDILHRLDF